MKNKLKYSLLFATVLSVFMLAGVSALTNTNITIPLPNTGGVMSGASYMFNCTIVGDFIAENYTTAKIYMSSVSTANSSVTLMNSTTNFSGSTAGVMFNGTINSKYLEDASDYALTCEVGNVSNLVNKTITGVIINNTAPASASLSPTDNSLDEDGDVTFTGTVIGANTTSCTLWFDGINPGSTSYAMTHTGNTCTYTITSIPERSYKWYIIDTDGYDSSTSPTNNIVIDVEDDATSSMKPSQIPKVSKTLSVANLTDGGIGIWVIVGIVALLVIVVLINRK